MRSPAHTKGINSTSGSTIPAFRLIKDQLYEVKKLIKKQLTLPAKARDINQFLQYINSHSGKMIRPALVLLSYGVVRDASCEKKTHYAERNTQYEVIRVAATMEMIHNATLLHDDVIDEGQNRRGIPTVNKLWGNESAVLLGDFLFSRVFKICSDLKPELANMIAAAASRTCEGELRQVIQRHNWRLTESEYIDIITEKSAVFFSTCCGLGALLAHANEAQIYSLEQFGLNTGIAFQITDDLLDLIGDESQTGKTVGSDVNKNKLTLTIIHLLKAVNDKQRSKIYSALSHTAGGSKEELLKVIKCHGSLEYAHSRAQEFVMQAVKALSYFPESGAKNSLIETAGFAAVRACGCPR